MVVPFSWDTLVGLSLELFDSILTFPCGLLLKSQGLKNDKKGQVTFGLLDEEETVMGGNIGHQRGKRVFLNISWTREKTKTTRGLVRVGALGAKTAAIGERMNGCVRVEVLVRPQV